MEMFECATTTTASATAPTRIETTMALAEPAWRDLYRRLKANHQIRIACDAREAPMLREADELALHVAIGYSTLVELVMAELDCSRHTANEKLRVAHELLELPLIDQAFRAGEISWSKVRELTRVATAETEDEWLDAIEGKAAHEVQQLVKGHDRGARPSDAPDPQRIAEWVGLEVAAAK